MKKKRKTSDRIKMRNKCDNVVRRMFRGLPCALCGQVIDEGELNTCGHHLYPRKFPWSRHNLLCLLPLCVSHHMSSYEISAHSTNALAVRAFTDYVEEHFPKHYAEWQEAKKHHGEKTDFEAVLGQLKEAEAKGREWLIRLVFEE